MVYYGSFQARAPDNDFITLLMLPLIKLSIKERNIITSLLQKGSLEIELTYQWIVFDKLKEFKLVYNNYLIKLQEIAPHIVCTSHSYKTAIA